MNKKLIMLSVATISILFTGCGGGGGASSSTQTITGNVIDGAIKESRVSLNCENSVVFNAKSKTDEKGLFTIRNIPESQDLTQCMLVAQGGEDVSDGDDLTGLVLKSNYKLFNKKTDLIISPLTNTVATIDSSNNNIEDAKKKAKEFLGLSSIEDLKKDPTKTIGLAKIAKKLTKIAKAKRKDGKPIGFVDLDDTSTSNITAFLDDIDSSILSDENKELIKGDLALIEEATDIKDVPKQSIVVNTLVLLKKAYKQTSYTSEQKRNLKILAKAIAEENKKDEKYQIVTRYHVRKALNDVGLLPEFNKQRKQVDGRWTYLATTILKDDLLANLNLEEVEFKKLLVNDKNESKIAIKDISSIILFDSSKYESIVGADLTKRREYYAFSDKSTISKLQELAKDSYSDTINDKVNEKTSIALANLGFDDMALENVADNIYKSKSQQTAYKNLGKLFLSKDSKENAKKAFTKEFEMEKEYVKSREIDYYSRSQFPRISRSFSKAGDDKKAQDTLEYLISLSKDMKYISSRGTLVYALENVSEEYYLNNNNLDKAKENALKTLDILQKMPELDCSTLSSSKKRLQPRLALYYSYRSAINSLMFGNDTTGLDALIKKWDDFAKVCYTSSPGIYDKYFAKKELYGAVPIAYKAFSGDVNGAIKDLDAAIADEDSMKAKTPYEIIIDNGLDAVLVMNNKEDLLFNTYFKNTNIFTSISKISSSVNLGVTKTLLSTPFIIKINSTDAKLESYLDKMRDFLDAYNYADESDIADVYGYWNEYSNKAKKGYLALAKFYKDLGKTDKAEAIFTKALQKVSSMATSSAKISALYNINLAMKELSLGTANKDKVLTALENTAKDSTMTDIQSMMTVVNMLASYGKNEEAKEIVERAYGLVPALVDGNLDSVENRRLALIGDSQHTRDNFKKSIANGYLQIGEKKKAKDLIDKALTSINTLEETVDKYKYLVDVAVAYGAINDLASAKTIFPQIKTTKESVDVKTRTADAIANYDAFLYNDVASIDSDGDNKPDFWDIRATQEEINASGLELDDDIDGDGILDTKDKLPYDKIK